MRVGPALYVNMRLRINGIALFGQPLKDFAGVIDRQQGAIPFAGRAFDQRIDIGIEPNHDRPLQHQRARFCVDERAAPGGDDLSGAIKQPRDYPPLPISEMGFTKFFKDFGDREPGSFDNGVVCIDKRQVEALGEAFADTGLANAHHTHQRDGLFRSF